MKKIKDMYMWELEEMIDNINIGLLYTGSKFYIDKPHHELCFDSDIFDDIESDLFWNIDICDLTFEDICKACNLKTSLF